MDSKRLENISIKHQNTSINLRATTSPAIDVMNVAHSDVRKLFMSSNHFTTILFRNNFMNLEHLELASTGLVALPEDFAILAPNIRDLNLNRNSLRDLTPLSGLKKLNKLSLSGNRLCRLRKNVAVLKTLKELEYLDFRDNLITVGFYNLTIQNRAVGRRDKEETENYCNTFGHPLTSLEDDEDYRSKLDEATQLRRRVYEMLIANNCPNLKNLDGVCFSRSAILAKDNSWSRLVHLGVLKESKARAVQITPSP